VTRQAHRKSPEHRRLIRRIRITGWSALSSLLVTIVGFLTWAHVVYPADRSATIDVFQSGRVIVDDRDRAIIITPSEDSAEVTDVVMVFYPGARVDSYSYLPPLAHLSETTGTRVVIAKVALNLALTDTRTVGELASLAGPFASVMVGGHSLGGVKACLEAEAKEVSHLLLLASYCANDLSDRNTLQVLTILGSNDGLTDLALVDNAAELLPGSELRVTVQGANHASFGAYGPQTGDAVAAVDSPEVWEEIATEVAKLLEPSDGSSS